MIPQTLLSLLAIHSVASHGFLYHPGPSPAGKPAVRNYAVIDHQIDELRNPLSSPSLCRGAAPGPVTPIRLANGKDFTITLAFSNGAQHIGPCSVQILDAKNPQAAGVEIVSVKGPNGCAKKPVANFETLDKSLPASQQCPNAIPSGLITNVSDSKISQSIGYVSYNLDI